jgi:uncharacterized OsmC-like protein
MLNHSTERGNEMAKFTSKLVVEFKNDTAVNCKTEEHSFVLDEHKDDGSSIAMSPGEAMLASLGACKAMVVKSVAEKMHLAIDHIQVEIEGTIDPDGFMGLNKDAKIGFSDIKTHYYLDTKESKDKIDKMIEYAEDHCPVMDTMVNPAEFTHEIHINEK